MPVVATSPYPSAEEVLQAARVLCNDAAVSIDGDVLADDQPFVFPAMELKYEYLQDRLIQAGIETYSKYGFIHAVPVVATSDPTTQIEIDYVGTFDGENNTDQPQLPVDLLMPLEFWERQNIPSPATNTNAWLPMDQASDSIGTRAQTTRFSIWDWENDTLFLPGATQVNDLKCKYLAYMPQITDGTSVLLVGRCKVAMANLMAALVAASRGGLESSAKFEADAEKSILEIIARSARKQQYSSYVRRPFRGRRSRFR